MDKETQEQLDRLEREIWGEDQDLSDIIADDVLSDVDALLAQENAKNPPKTPPQQDEDDEDEEDEYEETDDHDGLTIGLLLTASALCVGIIGVMIYWLENFL